MIGIIYFLVTKLPIIFTLIVLTILVKRIVNKEEGILDEAIWFAYCVVIVILYFIALNLYENHSGTELIRGSNNLFLKGVIVFYCITYTYLMLLKEEKKQGIKLAIALTFVPILLNFIKWIFTR